VIRNLSADDTESASETTTNTLEQTEVLAANDVQATSETTIPAIGQEHALNNNTAESTSEVTTPALVEDTQNELLANDVESASEVPTPALQEEAEYLLPDADNSIGSWTDQAGGTTNIYQSIDESFPANDSDYVRSELNPQNSTYKVSLSNPSSGVDTAKTHTVRYRYGKQISGSQQIDITVRLMEGVATIASWTHTNVSTTLTTAEQTLSAGEVSSISDYTNLFLEFEANAP